MPPQSAADMASLAAQLETTNALLRVLVLLSVASAHSVKPGLIGGVVTEANVLLAQYGR